ncbi:hypothetical protein REPUB_Repub12eG0012600 [Reevesia pubescens]
MQQKDAKMFSNSITNNIINPFAYLPSSSYNQLPPPPILSTHDSNGIFLNHHLDLLSAGSLLPSPQLMTESLINMALLNNATAMSKQDGVGGVHGHGGDCFGASAFSIPVKKQPVKKDRHSKICTAQGIRDRRVRLSIEIAREFFDLQDMLGFDKASKTLEWLLTKSKTAIRELVKMKHGNGERSLCSSPDPECEMVAENDGGELEGRPFKSKLLEVESVICKEKKKKKLHKATVPLPAKESRAKARARARERTREKMCTRCTTSPQFLNQLRSLTQLEESKKSSDHYFGHNHNMASSFKVVAHQVEDAGPCQLTTAAPRENVIEESIVIKRKLKPSTILGYQQNLADTKDHVSCSTNGHNYFPNLPQNWDINGAMAHSTFCAITNFNLSTGVQVYGKP